MIITIEGMHCAHCAAAVEKALNGIGLSAAVNLQKGEASAAGEATDAEIIAAIEKKGFRATKITR